MNRRYQAGAALGLTMFLPSIVGATLLWPIPANKNVSATYGELRSTATQGGLGRVHRGIDIASSGEEVISISSGAVTMFDPSVGLIETGYTYRYRHMTHMPSRQKGDNVNQGDVVGTSGSVGTTHAHLHFATGDLNGLTISDFNVPDTAAGTIQNIYIREPGQPDNLLTDGSAFNSYTSPEFLVQGFDTMDSGHDTNFYELKSTLDGAPLKDDVFLFVYSDENTYSVPTGQDIYAFGTNSRALQSVPGSGPFYYHMGIKTSIPAGQHTFCVYGYDLNVAVEDLSVQCTSSAISGIFLA